MRRQTEAQFGGFLFERREFSILPLLVIVFGAQGVIGDPVLEQLVNDPRDLVRRRHRGLLRPQIGPLAPVIGPKDRLTPGVGLRGLPQRLPRAIVRLENVGMQHFAAGDVVVRRQPQP